MPTVMLAATPVVCTLRTVSTVELDSAVEPGTTVVADSTVAAEATAEVVDTGNPLLENTNGWQHEAASRFSFLNKANPALYPPRRFLLEWRVAEPLR